MNIVNKLTFPGKEKNEDFIWHNDYCAVLFDGATSLVKGDLDAVDFIKLFINTFETKVSKNKTLVQAINETLSIIKNNQPHNDSLEYFPSAAAVFVLEKESTVELVNIGDCTAVVNENKQHIIRAKDSVRPLDTLVTNRMRELHLSSGKDTIDILMEPEIREMLLKNRKKMNTKDGYKVLSFNTLPVSDSELHTFNKNDTNCIVLYSDGFDLLEDEIINGNDDFSSLYDKLRKIENEDFKLNKYPRFKISDDASIMKITFS
ncbi:MAG: protein phosphatase 2C domain-containing protein [Ruminococcus sp.]|nr:protein phosphatase 2C domain-containing protein [Ruminococcus sp.]